MPKALKLILKTAAAVAAFSAARVAYAEITAAPGSLRYGLAEIGRTEA